MTDKTKTRIAEASVGLFVRKGVAQTTTKDIAAAAGIAEGTIYRHFESKEALVEHLFLSNYLPLAKTLDGIQKRAATTMRKLETIVRYLYEAYDHDPTIFRFMLITEHGATAKIPDGIATPVSVMRKVIKEGIKTGAVRRIDPQIATHLALGLILQPATAHVYGEITGPLAPRANDVVDALSRVLSA
ncbi:MAG: TetR/AcrR family transcriptional regulator [Alphaproteobacteria bacterium]|nr:TetR/AcrR family transcriptional regulator [Alphaproteobacteria bacterium]